jgi:hypothetical protein
VAVKVIPLTFFGGLRGETTAHRIRLPHLPLAAEEIQEVFQFRGSFRSVRTQWQTS